MHEYYRSLITGGHCLSLARETEARCIIEKVEQTKQELACIKVETKIVELKGSIELMCTDMWKMKDNHTTDQLWVVSSYRES